MTSTYLRAGVIGLALMAAAAQALAGADDYEFQAVSGEVKAGKGRALAIKLINKRTKKPVEGVVFLKTQLDMSPENMPDEKGRIAPDKPSDKAPADKAVYKFKADFTLSGVWALKLQAKVPGERETIPGVLILRAND